MGHLLVPEKCVHRHQRLKNRKRKRNLVDEPNGACSITNDLSQLYNKLVVADEDQTPMSKHNECQIFGQ